MQLPTSVGDVHCFIPPIPAATNGTPHYNHKNSNVLSSAQNVLSSDAYNLLKCMNNLPSTLHSFPAATTGTPDGRSVSSSVFFCSFSAVVFHASVWRAYGAFQSQLTSHPPCSLELLLILFRNGLQNLSGICFTEQTKVMKSSPVCSMGG